MIVARMLESSPSVAAGTMSQLTRVLDMPALLIGTIDQLSEDVRARRARLDLSYFIFADRDLESAAPLVERLNGTRARHLIVPNRAVHTTYLHDTRRAGKDA
jgi:hypothetical protein